MGCFDFIVLGEAPVGAQPGKGSLYNPAMWKHLEPGGRLLDDLNVSGLADAHLLEPFQQVARISSIGPNLSQPAEPGSLFQEQLGSVSVLYASGVNADSQNQTQGIYQKMSFSSHDLFACIKAALSGLASHLNALAVNGRSRRGFFFPLLVRTRSRRASLICCHTPS